MNFVTRVRNEISEVGLITLFFGVWFCVMVLFKKLILEEYQIEFQGLSIVLVGALVVAKVVLVLEHVQLGKWIQDRSAWVHVLVRTFLYAFGVLIVLLLEKAFEARHEYGGFIPSLFRVFQHKDVHHVLATTIGVTSALLVFNVLSVIRRHLGIRGLVRIFMLPLPEQENGDDLNKGNQQLIYK